MPPDRRDLHISWVALVAMIAAIAGGFYSYHLLQNRLEGLSRTAVPGATSIAVPAAQQVTIYYEDPTTEGTFVVQAGSTNTLSPPPVQLQVTAPSGAAVSTAPYERDLRFNHDGRVVTAVATFDAPTAGTYTIQVAGDVPSGAMVSAGEVVDFTLIALFGGSLVLFFASLALLVVSRVTRRRRPLDAGTPGTIDRAQTHARV